MRRRGRTYILGAASAAGVLAFAITPAAGVAASTTPKLAKCKGTLTTQLTSTDTGGLPPTSGKQKGTVRCKRHLGKGHEKTTFKTDPVSGYVNGTFVIKFKKKVGTVKGKFTLIPQEGSFGSGDPYAPTMFGSVGYAGTLKAKWGNKSKFPGLKGKGTVIESSPDSIHFKVVEKIPTLG